MPELPTTSYAWFAFTVAAVLQLCVIAVLAAVAMNFLQGRANGTVAQQRPSVIATGSMLGFSVVYYWLIKSPLGVMTFAPAVRVVLMSTGLLLVVTGSVVNILGRLHLGRNWANQATIYNEHTLVTHGVYGLVRHPLYASLVWMFFGAALIYQQAAASAACLVIFLPAMYARAQIEERLLAERFPEYAAYQRRVGMLFPRVWGKERR